MIEQLLTCLILMEAYLLMVLSFKTIPRKPAKLVLDWVKQGQGPVMVKSIGVTLIAVLMSSSYTVLQIRHRSIPDGSINSTDQIFLAQKLLQASLTGFLLFLSMLIDRFHHLMRERGSLKKIIKVEEKQLEDKKYSIAVHIHALKNEGVRLRARIKKLEFECQRKTNEAKAKEANVLTLKKQSEGFNLEYDRLLEYNQTLRNQLQSIDQSLLKDKQETGWTSLKSSILSHGQSLFPWGIQKPNKSRTEDNEVLTANQCHQLLFSGSNATSSPRHRRPIYQH